MKPGKTNSFYLYIAVLIIIAALGIAFFILYSGIFNVKTIIIQGTQRADQNGVLRLAEYVKGGNLFLVDTEALRRKTSLHPLVQNVEIQRKIPDQIVLQITERTPVGLILVTGGVIEVDGQGVFLRRTEGWPSNDYPVINGIGVPDTAGPGQVINSDSLQAALLFLAQSPAGLLPLLGELNVNQVQQITVFLTNGIEVRLGQAKAWKEKLESLLQLLQNESFLTFEQSVKYIDFSATKPVIGRD